MVSDLIREPLLVAMLDLNAGYLTAQTDTCLIAQAGNHPLRAIEEPYGAIIQPVWSITSIPFNRFWRGSCTL